MYDMTEKYEEAIALMKAEGINARTAAKRLKLNPSSLYYYVNKVKKADPKAMALVKKIKTPVKRKPRMEEIKVQIPFPESKIFCVVGTPSEIAQVLKKMGESDE